MSVRNVKKRQWIASRVEWQQHRRGELLRFNKKQKSSNESSKSCDDSLTHPLRDLAMVEEVSKNTSCQQQELHRQVFMKNDMAKDDNKKRTS